MSPLEAALLGIVQGLTEFLPVSSSGHLVLAQAVLGVSLPGVLFEITVHVATLGAVLWVYRGRVAELAAGAVRGDRASLRYVGLLALASVPAAALGLGAREAVEGAFDRPSLAAAMLLVTGCLVWTLKWTSARGDADELGAGPALWAGFAQALALLPGISRSGSTVAAGVWRGVDAVRMAEFSFLMSVPAIGGAALLQLDGLEHAAGGGAALPLATGFVAALVSGVAAIRIFVRTLEAGAFHRFGWYCWAVGGGYLAAAWLVPGLR